MSSIWLFLIAVGHKNSTFGSSQSPPDKGDLGGSLCIGRAQVIPIPSINTPSFDNEFLAMNPDGVLKCLRPMT